MTLHVGIRDATPALAALKALTNPTFTITDTKLYVPLVTLSTQDDNQLLEQLKTRFKRTIIWNNIDQTKNNNLNYLIDQTFTKVNRLFVLSFGNEDDRISYSKYYTPSVRITDFKILIDGKRFLTLL